MDEKPLPPLYKRGINLTKAIVRNTVHVLEGGDAYLEPEEVQLRLDICASCEYYRPSDHTCSECGCPLDEKAPLTAEPCPFMKWPGDLFR